MYKRQAYKNDSGDQSYVSWANKDGATYIFCIMQSPDTCDDYGYSNRRPALCETTKLIDWVFESFSIQAALDTDQALAEIPVKYSSDTDTLQLYPADSMIISPTLSGGSSERSSGISQMSGDDMTNGRMTYSPGTEIGSLYM